MPFLQVKKMKLSEIFLEMHHDKLPGGVADDMQPESFNRIQLKKGMKHELEHTNDPEVALEIAMDHLAEDPDYYKKLDKVEK